MTEEEKKELFQTLKREVRQLEGVSGCGGFLEQFIVYLEKDTSELRQAVLKFIGDKAPASYVRFINTGQISAGS
ncbi:MAG: hypothetical protein G01um101413_264 [Parcubacteria group bacterium Gr01-1014_13]|nr:MAG: hypothetical protein G01um101413_264 [Parcubacteria group bacterium Gr01-1014_13]